MSEDLHSEILKALRTVIEPYQREDIVTLDMISSLQITDDGGVILLIDVDPERGAALETMRQDAERTIGALKNTDKVSVILTAEKKMKEKRAQQSQKRVATDSRGMAINHTVNVPAKNIIVVASGKGGVGKSTVAANIAVYLSNIGQLSTGSSAGQNEALRIGLLDADIYGPSQPLMMGDENYKPELNAQKQLIPMERYGLKIMSIGFMANKSRALVWRGPMIQSAFYQMLRDTAWGSCEEPLDYLIIDSPPGTGDVLLTLSQKVKVSGAVIVSTPQDIALIDARRSLEMFKKTDVPVLGLVENMSTHICSNCGYEEHIFGHGGAEKEAETLGIPFLGAVPLSKNIRLNADEGKPIVLAESDSDQAQVFGDISYKIIDALA